MDSVFFNRMDKYLEYMKYYMKRHYRRSIFIALVLVIFTIICCYWTNASLPDQWTESDRQSKIWPDYSNLVIPPNIAPLNFRIEELGNDWRTVITAEEETGHSSRRIIKGRTVEIPLKYWKSLLAENKGKRIRFDIYVKNNGVWTKGQPIFNTVSNDPIDSYVAYRLIPPGQYFGELTLNQRNLENFTEKAFFDNNGTYNDQPEQNGTCGNCHYFRNGKTDQFLFHVRYVHGGTILVRDGRIQKLDTTFKDTGNAATYTSWHPTKPVILFSTNQTLQLIHSRSLKKNETFDTWSDLLLYDIEKNSFTRLFNTRNVFETFPCWSPDGKSLYYCSCDSLSDDKVALFQNTEWDTKFTQEDFATFKYNLWKIPFNDETYKFGKPELVLDAAAKGKSIAFPRISPDGRFLLYTLADFGTFPIMHRESDLWMLNLETGENRLMAEINSEMPETYHTWDSSGRWIVFSTRRDDGSFTRLYFSHIDEKGYGTKPFLLPQKNPEENLSRMKSYNIPEMVCEPIRISPGKIMRTVQN